MLHEDWERLAIQYAPLAVVKESLSSALSCYLELKVGNDLKYIIKLGLLLDHRVFLIMIQIFWLHRFKPMRAIMQVR